jgi:hypothetical protein
MALRAALRKWDFKDWSTFITLVIAIVGALNSVFGFYRKAINKKHNLTIDIAGMNQSGKRVSYIIAFINDGDYPEIVTDIESLLGQKGKDSEGLFWNEQRSCFRPFVVGPGEHKVITYETEYEIDRENMKAPFLLQEFVPLLLFHIRGPTQGMVRPRTEVGVYNPPEFQFLTRTLRVNFEDPRPHMIFTSHPRPAEYELKSLCP